MVLIIKWSVIIKSFYAILRELVIHSGLSFHVMFRRHVVLASKINKKFTN